MRSNSRRHWNPWSEPYCARSRRPNRGKSTGSGDRDGPSNGVAPGRHGCQSTVISVDKDAPIQQVASDVLGADRRLTLITSGALEFLRTQVPESFDLVFADAMPGEIRGVGSCSACCEVRGPLCRRRHAATTQLAGRSCTEDAGPYWAAGVQPPV